MEPEHTARTPHDGPADLNETFGELRAALAVPCVASWHRICDGLDRLDPARQPEIVPFVRDNLRRWPLELCEAPWRWIEAALAGEAPPALAVARRVTITSRTGVAAGFRRLLRAPELAGLEMLDLSEVAVGGQRAFDALARQDHLRLRHLRLEGMRLTDDMLAAVASAPWASRLEALHLESNQLGERGIAALCDHMKPGGLKELHLDGNPLDPDCMRRLTRAPLDGLEVLSLGVTLMGDESVEALMTAPWLASVTQLELAQCSLSPRGVEAITRSANMGGCARLSVWGNHLGKEGAEVLGRAENLHNLQYLGVFENQIGPHGFLALARAPWMSGLKILNARQNQITPWLIERAGKLEALGGLERLMLAFNSVQDEGVVALLKHGHMTRLQTLELVGCELSDLRGLSQAPGLPALDDLQLASNSLCGGEGDLGAFARSPRARTLRSLDLSACWLNDGEVAALASGPWPRLGLLHLDGNPLRGPALDALEARPWPALRHISLGHVTLERERLDRFTLPHDPAIVQPPARAMTLEHGRLHFLRSMIDDVAPRPWEVWLDTPPAEPRA